MHESMHETNKLDFIYESYRYHIQNSKAHSQYDRQWRGFITELETGLKRLHFQVSKYG